MIGKDIWYSKLRYSIEYGVSYGKVSKPDEPRACNWFKAPIGDKVCHYEIRVHTVREAHDQNGKSITSYDGGATWTASDGSELGYIPVPANPTVTSVNITWGKINEDQQSE